jgi:hypothetical protein
LVFTLNNELLSTKFGKVSQNEEPCDLCRLPNFVRVLKYRKLPEYVVIVPGQVKQNAHNNSVGRFWRAVKEMARQI